MRSDKEVGRQIRKVRRKEMRYFNWPLQSKLNSND